MLWVEALSRMHRKQTGLHARLGARSGKDSSEYIPVLGGPWKKKKSELVHLLSLRFFLSRLSPSAPLRFDEPPDRLLPVAIRSKIRRASQSGNAFSFL